MDQLRSCFKCSYETHEPYDHCPQCGQRLRTARQVRTLGVLQLLIGLFLVGLMGTITIMTAPLMLQAGQANDSGGRFNGTPGQAFMILGLFGLVIVFGVGSMLSGVWLIKTGRRSKWVMYIMLGLFVLVAGAAWLVKAALGG